ncbi:MAG: betaine/proline/choline family ABC transporter ATP-binding protein [Alicyclobacillus sp.]|nr:betaine/proline/choline family ABC transporter ATP-binding protein [Alicyclobacillus sp.]
MPPSLPEPAAAAVEFRAVSKAYGERWAVRDVNLALPRGQITALIGPSGCGKTTTMKLINRLIEPSAGEVWVEGQNVQAADPVELRRRIGYVIQHIGLFPHMTVEQNVALVPALCGVPKSQARRRAQELLDLVGLDPALYRHRYPRELSGGQQQRVGVARALAADPALVLMDEPFSALDPISREQLQDELLRLQSTLHKTIVFVTHDMDEALKLADLVVVMREGRVLQADAPEVLLRRPSDAFVRDFIGEKRIRQWLPGITSAEDSEWSSMTADTVAAVMVRAVTLRGDAGLAQAVRLMQRQRVTGLVLVNARGEYLGVVDVPAVLAHYGEETLRAADVMTFVDPVQPQTPVEGVLPRLQRDQRGFLPVVDEDGHVLGALTRGSVIDALWKRHEARRELRAVAGGEGGQ